MRSLLITAAGVDLDAGLASGADAVVIGLGRDDEARTAARKALERARQISNGLSLFAHVHEPASDALDLDLDALMPARPDGIVIEAPSGAAIQHVSVKLAVREAELGLADGSTKIIAIVASTPASVFTLGSFRGASRRLAALIFGGTSAAEGPAAVARSLTVLAAKSAGVLAIDQAPPYTPDLPSLKEYCKAAFRDGFDAVCALDRDQVAVINAVFARRERS